MTAPYGEREFREWEEGWHISEDDAAHHRPHEPRLGWSNARARGYQAEAERRGDWEIVREVPTSERTGGGL